MGLDLYVGPLSRYYAGDWETLIQQQGRAEGRTVRVVRPPMRDPVTDPQIARRRVVDWQAALSDTLLGSAGRISWTETPTEDYLTDKPDWGPFVGLCLLAAREDGLVARLPDRVPTAMRAVRAWASLGRRTQAPEPLGHRIGRWLGRAGAYAPPPRRYAQVVGPEIWLPLDVAAVIETPDIHGNRRTFGSSAALLAELRDLNARTYRASEATLDEWRGAAPAGDAFEPATQFALAVMLRFAEAAVERRLPLVLDY